MAPMPEVIPVQMPEIIPVEVDRHQDIPPPSNIIVNPPEIIPIQRPEVIPINDCSNRRTGGIIVSPPDVGGPVNVPEVVPISIDGPRVNDVAMPLLPPPAASGSSMLSPDVVSSSQTCVPDVVTRENDASRPPDVLTNIGNIARL